MTHLSHRPTGIVLLLPLAGIAAAVLATLALVGLPAGGAETVGTATLALADGRPLGTVSFVNEPGGTHTRVQVALRVPDAASGQVATNQFHGLHIHANDNAANGVGCVADPRQAASTWFTSADGHYRRSTAETHGSHAGDLASVYVNRDGRAVLELTMDRASPGELFDRAVVLHAAPDNFGQVPVGDAANHYRANTSEATAATSATGNAGDRIACGVIAVRR